MATIKKLHYTDLLASLAFRTLDREGIGEKEREGRSLPDIGSFWLDISKSKVSKDISRRRS